MCSTASGMPTRSNGCSSRCGDRRFADPAEQDRADRDAQLRAGEHQRAGARPARITVTALVLPCSARASSRSRRAEISANSAADEERVGGQAAARSAARPEESPISGFVLVGAVDGPARSARAGRCGGRPSAPPSPASAPGRRPVRRDRTRSARPTRPPPGCGRAPGAPGRRWFRIRLRGRGIRWPRRTSSMRSRPDTCQPLPACTTSGVASSCSSRTSPTISSIRSSTVTMPAVPPYSSTTSAVCRPLARICAITASPSSVDGTTGTGCASDASGCRPRSPGGTAKTCLTCTIPTVSSRSPVDDREPGEAGLGRRGHQVGDGVVGLQRHDLRPRRHQLLGGARRRTAASGPPASR